MKRTDRLWKELGGPGAPPSADARAVKHRVDAALDADPIERRNHMKRKLTYALAAAALAAALTGSALAVGAHLDAISAFFGGDPAPVADYLDDTPRTVSDKNYTFTVDSSVSAGDETYLVVTVKALNEETREFLFSDDFSDMDTFSLRVIQDEADTVPKGPSAGSLSVGPMDPAGEDSRSFRLNVEPTGGAKALRVRLGWMEEGKAIEVPLNHATALTVEIGGSGVGIRDYETPEAGTITIDRVTLSPLTCEVETTGASHARGEATDPRILFRMSDGSVRTQSQMMNCTSGSDDGQGGYIYSYRFHEVQDLDRIAAIIAFDVEYPLDGSKPHAVEHDAALDPVTVTRGERVEGHGYTITVRELTEKLGGKCVWNAESGETTCTYRGVSIVLRAGEKTAMVDGQPVEMRFAPVVMGGRLCGDYGVFFDSWGVDGFVQRTRVGSHEDTNGYVTYDDIVYHDWYIIP